LTFRELASLLDITSIEEDIHRAVHRKPAATEIRTVVAVYRRFVETARSPYNQTSLISRHRLELGISVYVSAFSRFASAAAKQSVKDIFFTTFNSPAIPTTLGRQELYSGVGPGAGLAPEAIPKDQLFVLRCSELRSNSAPQS
jgi:hypothetical protein